MLKQVLESIDEMLQQALDSTEGSERFVYVRCAKTLLEKTINGMTEHVGNVTKNFIADEKIYKGSPVKIVDKSKPFGEGVTELPMYEVEAKLGKLVEIKDQFGVELPLSKTISVNGEMTTYGEARGKSFQNVDLLL